MRHFLRILSAIFAAASTLSLAGCDDGHVDDPVYHNTEDSYTVEITGTFQSLDTWNGTYSVAAACFDGTNNYTLTQKVIPASVGNTEHTVRLTNVPTQAQTVEIAVVNSLRKRIATIYSYKIPEGQRYSDTIKLDVGTLNAGMFGAINQFVFQGSATNCSRCHSASRPAAGLDLSTENAYASLVNVPATKAPDQMRVEPGNAANSFLYKVISQGDDNVSYSHTGLFADEAYQPFLDIVKAWIDGGAKE